MSRKQKRIAPPLWGKTPKRISVTRRRRCRRNKPSKRYNTIRFLRKGEIKSIKSAHNGRVSDLSSAITQQQRRGGPFII